MGSIAELGNKSKQIIEVSIKFMERFGVCKILRACGVVKKCGISAYAVFMFIVGMVFARKNLYRLLESEDDGINFSKDTVYRMLNNGAINWELLQNRISLTVLPEIKRLTNEQRRCALVVDDTTLYRDRSKNVELLSRCYDHARKRFYKGFGVLTLGWADGQSFLPIEMRVLASSASKNLLCASNVKEDERTNATKRRKDAQTDKPTLLLEMLKRVKNTEAECKYVLFDSWFTCPKSLQNIKDLGYDVVGRLKKDATKYNYDGRMLNTSDIFDANKKRPGKSRYLLSVLVNVEREGKAIPAKIVYIRNRNCRKDWIALISTDVNLTEDEIIELYGKRWSIEPFFKVCKSNLKLETEFQSRSFDAIAAHVAIVFIRYTMLSLFSRENVDERSICEICYILCDELPDITLHDALNLIFQLFAADHDEYSNLPECAKVQLQQQFAAALPDFFKQLLAV